MSLDYLAGWFALILAVTIVGTLLIRIVALRAERRMHELRLERARRSAALFTVSGDVVEDESYASLRPFLSWLLAAFVVGIAFTLLVQFIASSALSSTAGPVRAAEVDAVDGSAVGVMNADRETPPQGVTEDSGRSRRMPASEESGPQARPSLLATQSSGSRDDPASSVALVGA